MLALLQFQSEAAAILAVLLSAALHKQNQQALNFLSQFWFFTQNISVMGALRMTLLVLWFLALNTN